jgi:hypothetical protein
MPELSGTMETLPAASDLETQWLEWSKGFLSVPSLGRTFSLLLIELPL